MSSQLTLKVEFLSTVIAFMVAFTSVCEDVLVEYALVEEGLATPLTF